MSASRARQCRTPAPHRTDPPGGRYIYIYIYICVCVCACCLSKIDVRSLLDDAFWTRVSPQAHSQAPIACALQLGPGLMGVAIGKVCVCVCVCIVCLSVYCS